jgi:hypothetical protein
MESLTDSIEPPTSSLDTLGGTQQQQQQQSGSDTDDDTAAAPTAASSATGGSAPFLLFPDTPTSQDGGHAAAGEETDADGVREGPSMGGEHGVAAPAPVPMSATPLTSVQQARLAEDVPLETPDPPYPAPSPQPSPSTPRKRKGLCADDATDTRSATPHCADATPGMEVDAPRASSPIRTAAATVAASPNAGTALCGDERPRSPETMHHMEQDCDTESIVTTAQRLDGSQQLSIRTPPPPQPLPTDGEAATSTAVDGAGQTDLERGGEKNKVIIVASTKHSPSTLCSPRSKRTRYRFPKLDLEDIDDAPLPASDIPPAEGAVAAPGSGPNEGCGNRTADDSVSAEMAIPAPPHTQLHDDHAAADATSLPRTSPTAVPPFRSRSPDATTAESEVAGSSEGCGIGSAPTSLQDSASSYSSPPVTPSPPVTASPRGVPPRDTTPPTNHAGKRRRIEADTPVDDDTVANLDSTATPMSPPAVVETAVAAPTSAAQADAITNHVPSAEGQMGDGAPPVLDDNDRSSESLSLTLPTSLGADGRAQDPLLATPSCASALAGTGKLDTAIEHVDGERTSNTLDTGRSPPPSPSVLASSETDSDDGTGNSVPPVSRSPSPPPDPAAGVLLHERLVDCRWTWHPLHRHPLERNVCGAVYPEEGGIGHCDRCALAVLENQVCLCRVLDAFPLSRVEVYVCAPGGGSIYQ